MSKEIDQFISYYMGVVTHLIHNRYGRNLSEYGVTQAQAKVLYRLNRHGDMSQSEIQKRLYIQPSTMNGIIESLLKNGLIVKTSSETDRRTKVISLTEKGKQTESQIWSEIEGIEKDLLRDFSEEEKQLMISWLKKMQYNMEAAEASVPASHEKEGNRA